MLDISEKSINVYLFLSSKWPFQGKFWFFYDAIKLLWNGDMNKKASCWNIIFKDIPWGGFAIFSCLSLYYLVYLYLRQWLSQLENPVITSTGSYKTNWQWDRTGGAWNVHVPAQLFVPWRLPCLFFVLFCFFPQWWFNRHKTFIVDIGGKVLL